MNIWLHRISHHAELAYPLLENGLLTIGYSDFSKPEIIKDCCSEKGWELFEKHVNDIWGEKQRTRYCLWRFIIEMKKGDWVVVPISGAFGVYEVMEDAAMLISEVETTDFKDWHGKSIHKKQDGLLYTEKGVQIDLGFLRKVKLLEKDIPRYEYADAALTARLKVYSTNVNITDIKESVNKTLACYAKKEPLNIYAQIMLHTQQAVLNTLKTDLKPEKFELLIKWYFERIGATSVSIPSKNEKDKMGDADVITVFEPLKLIIYVQVKFHGAYTDPWTINQIKEYTKQKDAMDDGYSKTAWVITSADDFSTEAHQYAKELKVHLVNGKQFTKMILEAGILSLDQAF